MTILAGHGQLFIEGEDRGSAEYKIFERNGRGMLYASPEVLFEAWESENVTLTLKGENTPTAIIVVSVNGGGPAEIAFKTIPRK